MKVTFIGNRLKAPLYTALCSEISPKIAQYIQKPPCGDIPHAKSSRKPPKIHT